MSKFTQNKRKAKFLDKAPLSSLQSVGVDLTKRCKFNFSYYAGNNKNSGDTFLQWESTNKLSSLVNKIKDYSREDLKHWKQLGIGKNRKSILEIYPKFPSHSNFECPQNIPIDVEWGRFRLDQNCRLAGFVIPDSFNNQLDEKTGYFFDKNTFYVVFLDSNHDFYPLKK